MTLTRNKIIGFGLIFILFVILISLLAYGLANRSSVTGQSGINIVGKPAPDFKINTFDDAEFTLTDNIGKPIVINFWASWCLPCREEAEILQRFSIKLNPSVVFVGVNIQDSINDANEFMNEFGIEYINGPDKTGSITIDYGVIGLPVTFFVDGNGIVANRWVGAISEPKFIELLDATIGYRQ